MCGRYVSTRRPQDLVQLFHVTDWRAEETLAPNWNVAPTNDVWAVLERTPRGSDSSQEVGRELRPMRWGLVPSWAKDMKIGARMINARVETVHEKPAFRRAFLKRRCLLPADGFYEWQQAKEPATGKTRKQPYFIHPEDDEVMALAGLYEYWRNPEVKQDDEPAAWLMTCTIITTEATDAAGRVHPRMPLALTPDHYDTWLDPRHQDPDDLRSMLDQPAGGHLDARTEVESACTEVKSLLEQNAETGALRTGVEKLATVSQKMGQAMYAQAQQTPTDTAGQRTTSQDEEGVVDAEIVDDDKDTKGGAA